jgi:TRAP-type C4-dicarboxylate transport system substrate-binding protein
LKISYLNIYNHIKKKSKEWVEWQAFQKIEEEKREALRKIEEKKAKLIEIKKTENLFKQASNYKKANEIRFYLIAL